MLQALKAIAFSKFQFFPFSLINIKPLLTKRDLFFIALTAFSFPISLEWNGTTVKETVFWFQYEQDPSLNSNVYDVASKLVQKHFPGEFGSERLVQKVVDIILRQTARKEGENKGLLC